MHRVTGRPTLQLNFQPSDMDSAIKACPNGELTSMLGRPQKASTAGKPVCYMAAVWLWLLSLSLGPPVGV